MTLTLDHITLTYPDGPTEVIAVDDVSLTLRPGEFTALVGESGSGKSSLLAVCAGLQKPTSGTVHVDGTRGLIFQQANLLESLTAREQLLITDHIRGQKLRPARADELLERVGLAGFGHRRMGQLSGGQRQRVNIARALMGEPTVLLADEPTSALDSRLAHEVVSLLAGITRETSSATLMVTHDRSILDSFDRVIEMRDGRVRALVTV
ncbi:ABC transporter ATP-binding protein [Corynebacterium sp.]|uniref:ABC transporter ATP-binding protein n=1 Tax=Corynebacterium sp. TaxID=1720 RepID=UPI0019900678|nr:ABC transporter ATP-binding protein [Corynebacterium sp.]HHU66326.1 ABC transporter ATP-binding protein [Corynebacterium sp.]